jgi:hypothetical protein
MSKSMTLPIIPAPFPLVEKDLEGISPASLRDFETLRGERILHLEAENATLRAQVAALHARLVVHDERLAEVRALGETPWVSAAKKGASIG